MELINRPLKVAERAAARKRVLEKVVDLFCSFVGALPSDGCTSVEQHQSAGVRSAIPQIAHKRRKSRKVKRRIDIMLDDVEGKIVESTKTPHRDQQQQNGPDIRVVRDQKPGGDNSGDQKQKSLGDDCA